MLYRQKKDTYIRNYDGVGYITSTGTSNGRCTNGRKSKGRNAGEK